MRLTIICGLNHVTEGDDRPEEQKAELRSFEAARVLRDLADRIETNALIDHAPLQVGDAYIINDVTGKRVGVADVFKD